jgi:hypothetical protein
MGKRRQRKRRTVQVAEQESINAAEAAADALSEDAIGDATCDLAVFRAEVFRGLDELAAAGGLAWFAIHCAQSAQPLPRRQR